MPEDLHKTLYRKWRPDTFQSVVGQEHITSILRHQIKNNTASHAYLFSGSRGTGKTTCAKIMAQAINCLSPKDGSPCGECEACKLIMSGAATDIVEMDAASNNGVDYIRDIKDEVIYAPAMLKSRVYIIDEVHMLSQSAFNALLKTLEEPPSRVVFILATTEIQKIPATIISRCQRFDFRRISTQDIASRLEFIAQNEGIRLTNEASRLIAKLSQGGMRDAISMLELCAGGDGDIDIKKVRACAGVAGRELLEKMVLSILSCKYESIFSEISYLYSSSTELTVFFSDLISFYRDMLVIKIAEDGGAGKYTDVTDEELQRTKALADRITKPRLLYHIKMLEDAFITMQKDPSIKRLCAEMTLIRMCDESLDSSPEALLARIASLEEKLNSVCGGMANGAANPSIGGGAAANAGNMAAGKSMSGAVGNGAYGGNAFGNSTSNNSASYAYSSNADSAVGTANSLNASVTGESTTREINASGNSAFVNATAQSTDSNIPNDIPFELSPEDIKRNSKGSALSESNSQGYAQEDSTQKDSMPGNSPSNDGISANGTPIGGAQANGVQADGVHANGMHANGVHADVMHADGAQMYDMPQNSISIDGASVNSTSANSASAGNISISGAAEDSFAAGGTHTVDASIYSAPADIISANAGSSDSGSSMHRIDAWAEVVSKIRKTDDGAAAMLDMAKAYISGGAVEIIVDNAFALMVVDNDDIKNQIASYLTATGTVGEIKLTAVKFKYIKQEKENADPLSELGR